MYDFYLGMTSIKGKTLTRLVQLACSVAFILFGYEQGVMGGVITGSAFINQFPNLPNDPKLQGFTVACYNLGCFMGGLVAAVIGERLGRKKTIILGCSTIAVGTAIQCSSFKLGQLIPGRIITGLGNGMLKLYGGLLLQCNCSFAHITTGIITSAIPVWHAELSKAKNRGALITLELAINVVRYSIHTRSRNSLSRAFY
jgi:MFS family permease